MNRNRASRILLFCVLALCGCTKDTAPPPVHPEMSEKGTFPNLSTVPPRPVLDVSVGEREKLYKDMKQHNDDANADLQATYPDSGAK